nr:hypothetical protein [Tanacetum cinerariifolium]
QRSDKVKDGVGYNVVPPPAADLYLSPKKDLSWTGLPEFADDTVTDYSRPSPTVEKMYRRPSKKPTIRGNQQNWNNLKTQQLGPDFVLKKKACFNYGDFSHLANDCNKRVQRETTRFQNHAYMSPLHIFASHRLHGAPMRPTHRSAGHRPHGAPMRPSHRPVGHRPHDPPMRPMRSNMNESLKAGKGVKIKNFYSQDAASSLGEDCCDLRAFNSRNLIADAASSLGEDCCDLRAFNSRNLIADAASSLGEDCWELNVLDIPTVSDEFLLPEEVPTARRSSHCQL